LLVYKREDKMGLISVAKVSEVPVGSKKKVLAEKTELILANVGGKFFALADKCPHLGGSLSGGILEGTTIKCPNHGAVFDLATGKGIASAKILFMKMNVKDAKKYRTEVRGNEVFVEV
jgi:3-phenylpropionate/trans-cinnamate dioxygenase ferredoxin subunit